MLNIKMYVVRRNGNLKSFILPSSREDNANLGSKLCS